MIIDFAGPLIEWRGPAPFYWVQVPKDVCEEIAAVASALSYGWGVIPVEVTLGETVFTTSIMPRQGGYLVPIKDAVRKAEGVNLGDEVSLSLRFGG